MLPSQWVFPHQHLSLSHGQIPITAQIRQHSRQPMAIQWSSWIVSSNLYLWGPDSMDWCQGFWPQFPAQRCTMFMKRLNQTENATKVNILKMAWLVQLCPLPFLLATPILAISGVDPRSVAVFFYQKTIRSFVPGILLKDPPWFWQTRHQPS